MDSSISETAPANTSYTTTYTTTLCPQCLQMFTSDSTVEREGLERDIDTGEFVSMQKRSPGGTHHSSPYDCESAAHAGCPICVLVWRHAVGDKDELTGRPGAFTTYMVEKGSEEGSQTKYPDDLWILQISFRNLATAPGLASLIPSKRYATSFALLPENSLPTSKLGYVHSTSTGSDESWGFAIKCLNHCLENHPKCKIRPEGKEGFLPTRMVDITGSEDLGIVKLRERDQIDKASKYVAVSHCWGKAPMITLSDPSLSTTGHKNSVAIDEFKAGISVERLPTTFRDAVIVTRRLGLRYLWIDAICIIQNSDQDWATEALTMHEVYSNAFCTLAATFSHDGNGGLFKARNPGSVNPIFVQPAWDGDSDTKLLARPLDFWKIHVSEAPLNQRAWVLQERVLSPRIIHFGMNQLLWECNTSDCCESFPEGLPEVVGNESRRFKGLEPDSDGFALMEDAFKEFHNTKNVGKETSQETSTASSEKHVQQALERSSIPEHHDRPGLPDGHEAGLEGYYLWSQVIEKYTTTKLTAGSDKLVAMAGLVKHFQSFLKDDCVSGLWRNILPSQLLWMVEDNAEIATFVHPALIEAESERKANAGINASRPDQWRAPTWSWASIDGPIAAPPPSKESGLISIDGVIAQESEKPPAGVTDNPNMSLNASALVVHGCLHFGRLLYNPRVLRWMVAIQPMGICMERPPCHEFANAELTSDEIGAEAMRDPDALAAATGYPDADLDIHESHFVFCLPVRRTFRRKALRHDEMGTGTPQFAGLLLIPTEGGRNGVYQRIGCFHIIKEEGFGLKLTTNECFGDLFATRKHVVLV